MYYPHYFDYRAAFLLEIKVNQSVFIAFPFIRLQLYGEHDPHEGDFIEFEETASPGTKWVKSGVKSTKPRVYRNSIKLVFTLRKGYSILRDVKSLFYPTHPDTVGFKMMFSITPRSQEPQQLSGGKYNCSVANFQDFKPVLHCNHLVECDGGEDEQDCDFHSEQCGHGMIDAGTKCYKLYRTKKSIDWYEASATCIKQNMQLVTVASKKEHDFLLSLVLHIANFSRGVFVGVQPAYLNESSFIFALYNRHIWRWTDGRIALYMGEASVIDLEYVLCGQLFLTRRYRFHGHSLHDSRLHLVTHGRSCHQKMDFDIFCEKKKANPASGNLGQVRLNSSWNLARLNKSFVRCPRGHVTRSALSCDVGSDCGVTGAPRSCAIDTELRLSHGTDTELRLPHGTDTELRLPHGTDTELRLPHGTDTELRLPHGTDTELQAMLGTVINLHAVHVPMFVCQDSQQSVHHTLVCDHIIHCSDKSDENFCDFPPCPLMYRCRSGQCVSNNKFCNHVVDCLDGTDEKCTQESKDSGALGTTDLSIVNMMDTGRHKFQSINNASDCPATHFVCPLGHCVPIFLRCNGVDDCPGREDEAECEHYTCPGLYRCLGFKACLLPDNLCDGYWQCPQHDDEMLCDSRCPDVCHCQGLAFVCSQRFNASSYSDLRLLDASGSDMTLTDMGDNPYLIHLNLSQCNIGNVTVLAFPNLRGLDLSWNKVLHIDIESLVELKNLLFLNLSSNPLSGFNHFNLKSELKVIDMNLWNTSLDVYNGSVFAVFGLLRYLNISSSRFTTITSEGFQTTPFLESLDVRGSPLTVFPAGVFRKLERLAKVYVDNYRLCCPVVLPGHLNQDDCHTKYDLLSSCEDLLKSNSYRIFLWSFTVFSLLGNISSLVSRIYLRRHGSSSGITGFGVFVSNLCLADSLMGTYLAIVGASDVKYKGQYAFHDEEWKKSSTCKFAGFLSLLSNEVSAFMISLITLDRLLVIRFPFSQVRFKGRSATVACVIIWTAGFLLATVPLLPVMSHWEFFSQTGLCLPLPFVGRESFHGYTYSFSIMIVLNFILFAFIGCGQAVIYWSVRASSMDSTNKGSSAREATVARRLLTVVLSDFLCWFPVGLLGVLASTGTAIPGEVNVAVAVFVLPLNSALNPFLYTLNVVKEKQQKVKDQRLMKTLETRIAVSQIRAWLQSHLIRENDLQPLI